MDYKQSVETPNYIIFILIEGMSPWIYKILKNPQSSIVFIFLLFRREKSTQAKILKF